MSHRHSEEKRIRPNRFLRMLGLFFVAIAVGILSWDVYGICVTSTGGKFSGLADLWQAIDKESFIKLQETVVASLSFSAWHSLFSPLMSMPLALFCGLPGVLMVRAYSPGIQVRPPSMLQLQMISAGMNPRRMKR